MDDSETVEPGRFLMLADTAELLNISVNEAYQLVRSGELPAIKVGTGWRIERDMLESYIDALYEETRRMNLWNQSEFTDIASPAFGAKFW